MKDGLRVLDADGHVVEPAAVFADIIPDGAAVFDLPATTPYEMCGDLDLLRDLLDHGFDAPSYLRAMDAQGIDAAVLYPSMGLFVPYLPELAADGAARACAAYNDWIAGYCATDPARLAGVGIVPRDPARAADEAGRAAALGLVGVTVRPNHLPVAGTSASTTPDTEYLDGPSWAPLYRVLEETGTVLAVHEALGVRAGATIGSDRFSSFAARHVCSHPLEQMTAAVAILLGGVCERHPALRVAFLESGTGWLPYWLHRLDEHREWMRDAECSELSLAPSEYFARQCVISSDPEDGLAAMTIDALGADHVVWASDFPHPDAAFPDAVDEFLALVPTVGEADRRAVLWDTPLDFYGLAGRFA
jgi:predicted TIM-barrel fold metal-dependent hydrolase